MTASRVRFNQPSTLQPFHKFHWKVGIAVSIEGTDKFVRVYFTEGGIISMEVPKEALDYI